jgi:hypothetical protein
MRNKKYFHLCLFVFGLFYLAANIHPFHIHPFRAYYHELLLVLAILLGVGMSAFMWHRISLPSLIYVPLGLCLVLLVQMGIGLTPARFIFYPLMILSLTGMAIILGANWTTQERGAEKICLTLAWVQLSSALLSVLMQLAQFSGIDLSPVVMSMVRDSTSLLRPFANVAQPNQLALLLCFGLASIWWLFQARFIVPLLAWFFALFLLWGLALTQSRIGWLIMPVFFLLCFFRYIGEKPLNRWALAGLLLIYVCFVLALPFIAQWMGFSGGSIEDRVGGRSERSVLLQQAWHIAKEHLWFGVGWFGFGGEQVNIAANYTPSTYAEHAHNIVLQFAAELGFPVTTTLVLVLLYWGWQCLIRRGAAKNNEIAFGLLCLAAVAMHSLVEFPLWYANVLLPMALFMGMLHQKRWQSVSISIAVPRLAVLSTCVVGLLGVGFVTADFQRVVAGFDAFRVAKNFESVPESAITKPLWTLLPDYFDYFHFMKIQAKENMSVQEIEFAESVVHRFAFVHVLSKMAEIYALNGRQEKAVKTLKILYSLHPFSYPEYADYWQRLGAQDNRYKAVFQQMPLK